MPRPRDYKARAAREKVLALIAQGFAAPEAYKAVGRTKQWFWNAQQNNPDWARQIETLLLARREGVAHVDFVSFRHAFFSRDTPWHHHRMVEAIESAPPDSITLILAPPEHGKTSLLVDYMCWKLALDPNFRIAVVSESQTLARKIVGQIARRMTDREMFAGFIDTYGPFKAPDREQAKPWNADALTLLRATHDEKDFSIEARGAGSQIYGARYDLIVLDDVQSTKNLAQTEHLLAYLRQDVLTRPSADGHTIVVGTRVGPGDLYETMLGEEGLVDAYVSLPAIDYSVSGDVVTPVALWPEQWPLDRLAARRKKCGEDTWSRVYMQRPTSSRSATFTEAMLTASHDDGVRMGELCAPHVVCAVDPAASGVTALVACCYDRDRFWLIDVEARQNLPRNEDIYAEMISLSARYNPDIWIMEVNAFQRGLARDSRLDEVSRQFGFRVLEHTTNRNKADPVFGVRSMASSFLDGSLKIAWGDRATQLKFAPLCEQLANWRPDVPSRLLRQDMVMALWFAWKHWQETRRTFSVDAKPWQRQALPWAPTRWRVPA